MTQRGHLPMRTCIGCRKKREKREMIWLTQTPEGVVRVNGRKPHRGRGFYLCPDLQCLIRVKRRKKAVPFSREMDIQYVLINGFKERSDCRGGRE